MQGARVTAGVARRRGVLHEGAHRATSSRRGLADAREDVVQSVGVIVLTPVRSRRLVADLASAQVRVSGDPTEGNGSF